MYHLTFEFTENGKEGHKFITTTGKPLKGIVTQVSLLIVNQYLEQNWSIKKWRKENRAWIKSFEYPKGQKNQSKPINYLIISDYIRNKDFFEPIDFTLPDLGCMWLDHAVEFKLNFHKSDDQKGSFGLTSGDLQTHYYGENYPIKPSLHREGRLFTSIQPQLIQRIINKRQELIQNSDKALTDDWIFDLRNLISDTISLIDISLTQFYIKAEYDPLPGWKFEKKIVGERHGRRLNDKFKWISQITGNQLNIEQERDSLNSLRELRNHLMHFDPPSLVVTIEEATNWLNQIIDIAQILVKLRQAINVDVSNEIINFLLQKEAIFVPINAEKRSPLNPNKTEDYYSSIWPKK